jgi:hypothetical protein
LETILRSRHSVVLFTFGRFGSPDLPLSSQQVWIFWRRALLSPLIGNEAIATPIFLLSVDLTVTPTRRTLALWSWLRLKSSLEEIIGV